MLSIFEMVFGVIWSILQINIPIDEGITVTVWGVIVLAILSALIIKHTIFGGAKGD